MKLHIYLPHCSREGNHRSGVALAMRHRL